MYTNLTAEIVNVTPDVAANFLKFNNKNRDTSKTNFNFIVNEMRTGRFLENGESIIFDKNGVLKDGQHRLSAIVETGKTYKLCVVRGVNPDVMATLDTGKNRSAADVLSLNGFQNTTRLAALIVGINAWSVNKSKQQESSGNKNYKFTNQLVLEYCQNNYEWLFEIIKNSDRIYKKQTNPKVLTNTQIALFAYLLGGESPDKSIYDLLNNVTGVSRSFETAASYLYIKLYNSKINKEPLNFYWILGMTFKAYNYFIDGNPAIKYFKFSVEDELPKVKSLMTV
jgi:hypothetical protein